MSIYRGSQKIKELRFGGSQKIKEAYVGSQLVYKGGWDASPVDGVMFTPNGSFVSYTGINYNGSLKDWRVPPNTTGKITGIVFGINTTSLIVRIDIGTGKGLEFLIDNESVGIYKTSGEYTIPIPSKFITGNNHTISIKNLDARYQSFTNMSFNV